MDFLIKHKNRLLAPKYLYKYRDFKTIIRNAKETVMRSGYDVVISYDLLVHEWCFKRFLGNDSIKNNYAIFKELPILIIKPNISNTNCFINEIIFKFDIKAFLNAQSAQG